MEEIDEVELPKLIANIINRLTIVESELFILKNADKYIPQIGFTQLSRLKNPEDEKE